VLSQALVYGQAWRGWLVRFRHFLSATLVIALLPEQNLLTASGWCISVGRNSRSDRTMPTLILVPEAPSTERV
jgi:hypothetical protein